MYLAENLADMNMSNPTQLALDREPLWSRKTTAVIAFAILCVVLASFLLYKLANRGNGEDFNQISFVRIDAAIQDPDQSYRLKLRFELLPPTFAAHEPRHVQLQKLLSESVVKRDKHNGFLVAQALLAVTEHPQSCKRHPKTSSSPLQLPLAQAVFYRMDQTQAEAMLYHKHSFDSKHFGVRPHEHIPVPNLVFHDLGREFRGVVDFVVDDDVLHAVLGDVWGKTRIIYAVGSLREGKWQSQAYVLAEYRAEYSPRVSAIRGTDGAIHLFWIQSYGASETLQHASVPSNPSDVSIEKLATAKTILYEVTAMSNGDLVVLCKAENFDYGGFGFRIGSDFSLNLRICRDHTWTPWRRFSRRSRNVPIDSLGSAIADVIWQTSSGEVTVPVFPDLLTATIREVDETTFAICVAAEESLKVEYQLEKR